jgi:hypothetical protein
VKRQYHRLIIPLTVLAFGIYIQLRSESLIRNSSKIQAELISKPVEQRIVTRHGEREDSSHVEYGVDYKFTVDGITYTGHDRVKSVRPGDWITVYYEIGNPANNRTELPSGNEGWIWIWLALLLGLVMNRKFWGNSPSELPETGTAGNTAKKAEIPTTTAPN